MEYSSDGKRERTYGRESSLGTFRRCFLYRLEYVTAVLMDQLLVNVR